MCSTADAADPEDAARASESSQVNQARLDAPAQVLEVQDLVESRLDASAKSIENRFVAMFERAVQHTTLIANHVRLASDSCKV